MDIQIEVSEPQRQILQSTEPFNLFLAGVGSGKTHLMGILAGDFIVNYPHVRGFIGANTYGQLSKATLSRVFEVWESTFGFKRNVDYVVDITPPDSWILYGAKLKEYKNVITFNNGCTIFVGSLDNYKVIDGTEFAWALLDETKDTKEEAVKEVITARLRQSGIWIDAKGKTYKKPRQTALKHLKGYNPLFVFTSPAKVDWINGWFDINDKVEEISQRIFSKTDYYTHINKSKRVVISSTYHNQRNLPSGYIESRIDVWDKPMVDMLIYGSPIAKTGGEWFSRFDRIAHVEAVDYNPDLPLHISFDFNVVPYMTLLVAQYERNANGNRLAIIKEYCLKSPENTTEDCCLQLLYDYGNHKAGIFYYGDPSGRNRTTVSKTARHNYDVVEDVLGRKLNNSSNRVLHVAPSLARCRDFCNRFLNGAFNVSFITHPNCVNLIADFEFLKEGVNGGYIKKKVTDKHTGGSYEKYGHCADAWRYLVVAMFEDDYDDFV